MKLVLVAISSVVLASCASPTKELFDKNAEVCPQRCVDSWTGWVQIEPKMIICVCKDNESFREVVK